MPRLTLTARSFQRNVLIVAALCVVTPPASEASKKRITPEEAAALPCQIALDGPFEFRPGGSGEMHQDGILKYCATVDKCVALYVFERGRHFQGGYQNITMVEYEPNNLEARRHFKYMMFEMEKVLARLGRDVRNLEGCAVTYRPIDDDTRSRLAQEIEAARRERIEAERLAAEEIEQQRKAREQAATEKRERERLAEEQQRQVQVQRLEAEVTKCGALSDPVERAECGVRACKAVRAVCTGARSQELQTALTVAMRSERAKEQQQRFEKMKEDQEARRRAEEFDEQVLRRSCSLEVSRRLERQLEESPNPSPDEMKAALRACAKLSPDAQARCNENALAGFSETPEEPSSAEIRQAKSQCFERKLAAKATCLKKHPPGELGLERALQTQEHADIILACINGR